MQTDTRTRADGGSAASQAADLDDRSWTARPAMSFIIRAVVIVIPILGSVAVSYVYRAIVPSPHGLMATIAWWVGAFAAVVVSMRLFERAARRLLPVALMFQMSLVFPDNAPSRFKTALTSGTTRQLQRQLDDAESGAATATPNEAAQTLLALVARLSSHDRQTRGHSERVRGYTDVIAKEMGLGADDREKLHWAALIHDVGKLRVPAEILSKNGQPTDEEWEILKEHPAAGERLVDPLRPWLGEWALATTQHHERYDGKGYPLGLSGDEISLAGRIVAVADAYDVMTSTRSYKKSLPAAQARAELARNAGTQFDPTVVRAFLAVGLGRTRAALGPLAWLTELPALLHVPTAATASVGTAATAAATAAAVSVGSVMAAGGPIEPATPVESVERVVEFQSDDVVELSAQDDLVLVAPQTDPVTARTEPATSTTTSTTTTTIAEIAQGSANAGAPSTTTATTTTAPPAQVATTTNPPVSAPTTTAAPTTTSTTTTTPTTPAGQSIGPTATDDHVTVGQNSVYLTVLANDAENGNSLDPSTLTIISAPHHAQKFGTKSGQIRYNAAPGYTGPDRLTYRICDAGGGCDTAILHISVE